MLMEIRRNQTNQFKKNTLQAETSHVIIFLNKWEVCIDRPQLATKLNSISNHWRSINCTNENVREVYLEEDIGGYTEWFDCPVCDLVHESCRGMVLR